MLGRFTQRGERAPSCAWIVVTGLCASALLAPSSECQGVQFAWPVSSPATAGPVAGAGDVDLDGTPDVLLVRNHFSATLADRIELRSGRTGHTLLDLTGATPGLSFGTVASLDDIDGDSRVDFAVACHQATAHSVRAYSSASGVELWRVDGVSVQTNYGRSMAVVADFDLDGVDDLLVGTFSFPTPGATRLLSGATGAPLVSLSGPTGASPDFGLCVGVAGDVDADGAVDVFIGDTQSGNGPSHVVGLGRVTIHSLRTGAVLQTIDGPSLGSRFGLDVAALGDVNADGVPDLAIASGEIIVPMFSSGRVRLHAGHSGALLRTFESGSCCLLNFGEAIEAAPDLDGDGQLDLLLSAGLYRAGCCSSWPADNRVCSSATGAVLQAAEGQSSATLVSVPDANHDGHGDYLVGGQSIDGTYSSLLVLNRAPATISNDVACPAKVTSQGCAPSISSLGAPSATIGDSFVLRAHSVVPSTFGVFVWSRTMAQIPFGGGSLCIGTPLHRLGGATSSAGSVDLACAQQLTGTMTLSISKAQLAATGIAPGGVFFAQAWFRDPGFASPNDIGLTSSISITMWP